MNTQNTHMQGILGYQEVQRKRTLLSGQASSNKQDIRNLISLAKRCSKAVELDQDKRAELRDIAQTFEITLKQHGKEK